MKSFLAIAVVIALVAASINALLPAFQSTGAVTETNSAGPTQFDFIGNKTVTKIIDGDTVIAEGESIRLLGIDADEKGYPCYNAAKTRIEELVLGKEVYLEPDAENKDQYGRYLRYLFIGNQNANLQLVKEGLAVARFSPGNTKYKEEILAAETAARGAGTGCKWNGTDWNK
jgi:micrococcal nuclease